MATKLSTEYTKEEIDELISKLRICDICHRGYFEGGECPYLEVHILQSFKPLMIDRLSVNDIPEVVIVGWEAPKVRKKKEKNLVNCKLKKCEVCGKKFKGEGLVCSPLCRLRSYSITYYSDGHSEIFMSVEEGIKKLEKLTGKKYVDKN